MRLLQSKDQLFSIFSLVISKRFRIFVPRNFRVMSIELSFRGRIKSRKRLVEKITEMADRHLCMVNCDTSSENDIVVSLCPTGDILFHVNEGGLLQKAKVEGHLQSTPAGPGFHKAAVDFIDSLEMENLVYEDDTDYADDRDFKKLCKNHFYRWLESIMEHLRQTGQDGGPICLCWSTEQYQPNVKRGKIVTPIGLWDISQICQWVQDKGIEALADRFFIWPHEQQDAVFYRNCALKTLWEDCYYVPSGRSETDAEINKFIIENLEKAYSLAPLLPLPYDSYCEICHLDGRKPIIPETAVQMDETYKPGHRKGLVKENINGLTIIIPGSYKRSLEFDNDNWSIVWNDSSSNSPVWRLSIFGLEKEMDTPKLKGNHYLYSEKFDIEIGKAVLAIEKCQENDEEFLMVICQITSGLSLYLITVTYNDQAEFDQIRDLLHRITCQKIGAYEVE